MNRAPHAAPLRAWARTAGLGYLVIIVTGVFAELFVRRGLLVPGDAAATAVNIVASEALFRVGIASEFVMLGTEGGVAPGGEGG